MDNLRPMLSQLRSRTIADNSRETELRRSVGLISGEKLCGGQDKCTLFAHRGSAHANNDNTIVSCQFAEVSSLHNVIRNGFLSLRMVSLLASGSVNFDGIPRRCFGICVTTRNCRTLPNVEASPRLTMFPTRTPRIT